MLDVPRRMTFLRCLLLVGVAGFTASLLLESPVGAQLSAHPSDDKKLPPVPADEPIDGPVFLKCGPMLGHVAPDRALIWMKASNAARASVKVSLHADLRESRLVPGPMLGAETAFAGVVEVPDLAPDTRYYYNVLLDDEPATVRPALSFVTAPAKGGGKLRVAFVSCSGYRGYMSAASWGEMAERANFDVLLQLGDNHYANTSDIAKQRADYTMHRQLAGFRALTAKVPCYGIWDDHDYGPNNSDATLKGKEDSLRAFKEFWANPAYGLADAPGCFFKFSRGDVDFFMLDVRYHRSPDKAEKDEHKTMLGAAQREWLKRELKASTARVKFIASGSVFESKGTDDAWSMYPHERRALLDFLKDEVGDGVILLSGDRHFTAGYQIDGRLLEVTTGPLGSGNATAPATDETWLSCSIGKMWSVFEVDTSGETPKVAFELWLTGAGLAERRELTWDEVNGRTKIAPSPALPKGVQLTPKPAANK